jgi:phospholipase/carboxylesterase
MSRLAHVRDGRPIGRRSFVSIGTSALVALWSCRSSTDPSAAAADHLVSRPGSPSLNIGSGMHSLGLGESPLPGFPVRDGLLYIPQSHDASTPIPLLVLLHGAGASGSDWFGSYKDRAELHQFAMLAPDSRDPTWDVIETGAFGPDVRFIDRALGWTFARLLVDQERLAIVGFSDGASYALSLGLSNGDLFSRVVAYSGCILSPGQLRGKPKVYMTHGTADPVLPIDGCSRVIAPELRASGYLVDYVEFDGGHEVPSDVSTAAMTWLAQSWGAVA